MPPHRDAGWIERNRRHSGGNRAAGLRDGRRVGHGALTGNPHAHAALLDFDLGKPRFVEKARKGAHHVLVHYGIGFLPVVGRHQLNSVSLWKIAARPAACCRRCAGHVASSFVQRFYANSDGPQICLSEITLRTLFD